MGEVTIPMMPGPRAGYDQAMNLLRHIRANQPDHQPLVHIDGKLWAITIRSETCTSDELANFYRPAVYLGCLP